MLYKCAAELHELYAICASPPNISWMLHASFSPKEMIIRIVILRSILSTKCAFWRQKNLGQIPAVKLYPLYNTSVEIFGWYEVFLAIHYLHQRLNVPPTAEYFTATVDSSKTLTKFLGHDRTCRRHTKRESNRGRKGEYWENVKFTEKEGSAKGQREKDDSFPENGEMSHVYTGKRKRKDPTRYTFRG